MSGLLRAAVTTAVGLVILLAGSELWAQPAPLPPPVYTPLGPPGQPEEPPAAPHKPVVTPPKLKKFVEAAYPAEALEQGLAARVELELVIAADGTIKDLKVVGPAGHGFDEAALEAVRQFEFEPAQKDGQPVAARIRYPYVFEIKQAPAPEPPPEAPPPPGRLEGQVLGAEKSAPPLVGAEITVTAADGQILHQTADADGRFAFDGLEAGNYSVRVQAQDRQAADQQEELRSGEATTVTYRLLEPVDTEAFGATARISPPPREVTRRTIGKEEMTRIPGTRGDALRTVELMPGVARPPLGAGVLIVRGSAPGDTQALFEGLPVPILYHFGGLTSFVNSRMLDSIEFYPGNFSVRYGRRRGGVIDVRAADIPREDAHGVADLNLIDASLLIETPLSKDAEVALAARRSYFDAVFAAATKGQDISTIAAPVYYDYQAMATYRPSDKDKLRLMVFGSSDRFKLLFQQPSDTDSSVAGNFNLGTQFHRVHSSWRRQLSDTVEQDIDLAVGYLDVDVGLGNAFSFNLKGTDIYQRSEWRARVTDQVRLIAGVDMFFFPGNFTYVGPPPEQSEGNPAATSGGSNLSNRDQVTASDQFLVAQPAIYLESDINLAPWLFILGSRVDYFSEIHGYTYDPRGAVHYTLNETTALKAGAGLFSQPPEFQESSPKLGNPHLKPTHTVHLDVGADEKIADNFTIGVDGFYKHLFERVVGTDFGQAPYFTNGGQGRVFGLEFSVRILPQHAFLDGRFFGYLSYTLSRSERRDHTGESWKLFDYDQTHILTVSAVYRLGRGWETGATFRLVSGNPRTPVVGANLNTGTDQYSPIYGVLNSERNPAFNRLDIRIEKTWKFSGNKKLALYLDVQNVYNAVNPEGTIYDYEYRKQQSVRGLPIIPNLGLRGEM